MIEEDVSKDEIILWLHKRADEIMWNDEICLDQLIPRSSWLQRAGEINTRLQIARLPAPSIFDAPKGGVSRNQGTHEVTLTRCGHDDADQEKKVTCAAGDQDHMVTHSDVKLP